MRILEKLEKTASIQESGARLMATPPGYMDGKRHLVVGLSRF